jgi:hypothetical protein
LGGCVRCLELNHTGSNCSSPQGVVRVLRRVTNLSFVKAEAGQGFFGGPRCEIASPAQQIKRRVWNIKRQRPTVFLPQIHELQKTPASVRSLQPRSPCPTAAISIPRKLRQRRRWRTLWLILLHSWWRVPEIKDRARPAHGRIVINGNPPRRHDEYAIVSLVPPPPRRINFMILWKKSWHFWKKNNMLLSVLAACLLLGYVLCNSLPRWKGKL